MSLDTLSIVDAVYRVSLPEQEWLQGISNAAACLGEGRSVYAFTYDASNEKQLRVRPFEGCGTYRGKGDEFDQMARADGPPNADVTKNLYWGRWSVAFAEDLCAGRIPKMLKAAFHCAGASNAYAVRGFDGSHRGVMLTVPVHHARYLAPRTSGALHRIAAHLSAAFALRQVALQSLEAAPAIFDREGRLEYAGGTLRADPELDAVQRLVARFVSTAKMRRQSPDRAEQLWAELIGGRWSVLEHVDSDGRRFIVAQKSAPNVTDPRTLSGEELSVARSVSRGSALKVIAHELGLSPTAVSYRLKRALLKLGLRHKSELVGFFEGS